ncbi:MAG: hypothetical protein R3D60_13640 [Paracoccaceae bacterium]
MFKHLILPAATALAVSAPMALAQSLTADSLARQLAAQGYTQIEVAPNGPILIATAVQNGQQVTLAFDRETGQPVALNGAANDGYNDRGSDGGEGAPGNDSGGGGEGDGVPANNET